MQFPVPQFIDVEDKVVGPLTIKQFLWLFAGAGVVLVLWMTLPTLAAIALTIPTVGLAIAFAFFKVNGSPFYLYLGNLAGFVFRGKVRIWKRNVVFEKAPLPQRRKPETGRTKLTLGQVNLDELVGILNNELSPQGRQKPVSDPFANQNNQNQNIYP